LTLQHAQAWAAVALQDALDANAKEDEERAQNLNMGLRFGLGGRRLHCRCCCPSTGRLKAARRRRNGRRRQVRHCRLQKLDRRALASLRDDFFGRIPVLRLPGVLNEVVPGWCQLVMRSPLEVEPPRNLPFTRPLRSASQTCSAAVVASTGRLQISHTSQLALSSGDQAATSCLIASSWSRDSMAAFERSCEV